MAKLTSPLRFVPFLRPLVWGSRQLATELNKILPSDENYGESWEISDHVVHDSKVAIGPWAGTSLRSLLQQQAHDLLGPASDSNQFPWLVKFLDAHDWLSVQVHPDDHLAQRLRPGEKGKTEAWFILSAQPDSRVYAGLQPGIGPDDFRRAVAHGTVANLLHSFTPRAGDFLFLPAGTVHAVGGGVVLAEVQQSSDVTFRLFDWNRVDAAGRARQLHVEEGLTAIDWERGPIVPTSIPILGESDMNMSLVRCRHFELAMVRHRSPIPVGGQNTMRVLIVLAGRAQLGSERLCPGEVWLLPACLPETTLKPEPFLVGLSCTMPSTREAIGP